MEPLESAALESRRKTDWRFGKYVEEGGSFGVCTGRSPDSVKGFIGDLPINTLSVVNGGCALYDFQKGEYLDELCVEEDALQFAFSMKKGVGAVHRVQNRHCESYELLAGEDKRGSDCLPAAISLSDRFAGADREALVSDHFMRIGAGWNKMCRICQRSEAGWRQNRAYGGYAGGNYERSIRKGGCTQTCLQISWRNCRGSRVYRRFFLNDIGALEAAGLSACVKNAPREVKDCCDMVLSDCMDGAVAEFIERVQKII